MSKVSIRLADLSERRDAQAIDAFVREAEAGTPFHLSGWSRAIARGCGQRAHYLVAERAGSVAGVLPLTEIRSRIFGSALVSAGFAVGGGIIAKSQDIEEHLVEMTLGLAKQLHCPTIELRGSALPPQGWERDNKTYLSFARPLAQSDEAELLSIPRKQRAEVRRALGLGLEVVTASGDGDEHYRVYAESVRNLGTPVFPKRLFDAVRHEFGDEAEILTIRRAGTAVASVLSLYWRGTVMPYWGGGTHAARACRANDLMYFALMCHARTERGCTRFDFGRSKAGTGAAAFKRNWGFPGEPLIYARYAATGAAARNINPLSPGYRLQVAAWQHLPLWIANRAGPWIARGLG